MRKTKTEALKTRSNVLKSAMKVFLEKGYSQTSLADIAKNDKITKEFIFFILRDLAKLNNLNSNSIQEAQYSIKH